MPSLPPAARSWNERPEEGEKEREVMGVGWEEEAVVVVWEETEW